jgi:hypothetical protein
LLAVLKDKDLEEDAGDHPGAALPLAEAAQTAAAAEQERIAPAALKTTNALKTAAPPAMVATAAMPATSAPVATQVGGPMPSPVQPGSSPAVGVLINVDGAVVPSFTGKSLRSAVVMAQEAGLVLEAHGQGIAREQSPAPGTRLAAGGRVAVRFSR